MDFSDLVETAGRVVDLARDAVIAGGVLWITVLTLPKIGDPAAARHRMGEPGAGAMTPQYGLRAATAGARIEA